MNTIDLPKNAELAGQVIAARQAEASKRLEMGLMGKIFGAAGEKPGNIAGFIVVASFIVVAALIVWGEDTQSLSKRDAISIIAGFITLGLGFLFGRATAGE